MNANDIAVVAADLAIAAGLGWWFFGPCGARIHDRGGDLLLLAAGRGRQAAIWYSCVSPPRTCFRRIRYSARLISGGRVSA
jgi:hypothetical protein